MLCKQCNRPTSSSDGFCNPKHKRLYNEEHALCLYPDKMMFYTGEDAWEFIDSRDGLYKTNLRPFDCPGCGWLHIGHGSDNNYTRHTAVHAEN